MTTNLFSLGSDLGGILIALFVVGALVLGVSTITEEPSAFSKFLRRKPTEDARIRQKRN
jgi:hypothetical protein